QEAVLAFSVCVGAAPGNAACFHNRALALTGLGRAREALADYDRALRLEPTLAAAALNRGMLHYQEGRHDAALADLQPALARAAAARPDLALVQIARQDRPAALAHLQQAVAANPTHREAAALLGRLRREH